MVGDPDADLLLPDMTAKCRFARVDEQLLQSPVWMSHTRCRVLRHRRIVEVVSRKMLLTTSSRSCNLAATSFPDEAHLRFAPGRLAFLPVKDCSCSYILSAHTVMVSFQLGRSSLGDHVRKVNKKQQKHDARAVMKSKRCVCRWCVVRGKVIMRRITWLVQSIDRG